MSSQSNSHVEEHKLKARKLWLEITSGIALIGGIFVAVISHRIWVGLVGGILTFPWVLFTTRAMLNSRDTRNHEDYNEATLHGLLLGGVSEFFFIIACAFLSIFLNR